MREVLSVWRVKDLIITLGANETAKGELLGFALGLWSAPGRKEPFLVFQAFTNCAEYAKIINDYFDVP